MALINCPECGKEISDKAKGCPNCGRPMSSGEETKKKKKSNDEIIIFFIIFIAAVIILGAIILCNPKQEDDKIDNTTQEESSELTTPEAIYERALECLDEGDYAKTWSLLGELEKSYLDVDELGKKVLIEAHTLACYEDFKYKLKNPDSFSLIDLEVYYDSYSMNASGEQTGKLCVNILLHGTAQNGFGGNDDIYAFYTYPRDSKDVSNITYLATFETLDSLRGLSDVEASVLGYLTYNREYGAKKTYYDIGRLRDRIKDGKYVLIEE